MSTRLRAQEAAFLAEETVYAPRQVATLAILDPGPDGFDHQKLLATINERIAFVPRYRQRVLGVPGNLGRAVWTDDEDFDLTYHVRRSAVPRPGTLEQLRWWVGWWLGGWTGSARCGRRTSSKASSTGGSLC